MADEQTQQPAPGGQTAHDEQARGGQQQARGGQQQAVQDQHQDGEAHDHKDGASVDSAHEADEHEAGAHEHGHGESAEDDDEEGEEQEETGLWHVFRERAISLRTMERPLRLITGVALAELIVAAALLAIRGLPLNMAPIPVYLQDNQLFQMPLPIFVVSMLFLTLAWSYMLAGALHAHPIVRVLGLGLFTWAMWTIRGVVISEPYRSIETALLAALWLVGLATWLIDRRAARAGSAERSHGRRFRGLTFLAVFVPIAALYGVAWLSLRGLGALLFPSAVSVQLSSLQFVLMPVLFLAGTDFAEWGEATGERLAELGGRLRPPYVLAALTALAGVAVLVSLAVQLHHEALHQLILGLIVLALVLLLLARLRVHRALPARVPYAALAITAIVYFAVMFAPSLPAYLRINAHEAARQARTHPTGTFTTYRHETPPHFSLSYPAQWSVQALLDKGLKQPLMMGFNGISAGNASVFYVIEASAKGERTLDRMLQQWLAVAFRNQNVRVQPAPAHGPWQVRRYVETPKGGHPVGGYFWQRRVGALDWLLMSQEPVKFSSLYDPTFTAMVDSWTPTLAAESGSGEGQATESGAAISDGDRLAANMGLFWLVVAIVAGAALALGARRLRSGPLAASALFVAVAGLLFFFSMLPTIRLVYGATLRLLPAGQHLGIPGDQAAVALVSLAVVAWLALRRRLTARAGALLALLFGLNVSLQIVSWIFQGYDHASDLSGRLSVAQAIIVLLALLWDVTMSGEEITNVNGRLFPRHTRVLLFFGYVILVATMVLYFSSLQVQATGKAVEAQFETEIWPQTGLLGLGVPLLLALFVLKACRWLNAPGEGAAAPSGEPEPHGSAKQQDEQVRSAPEPAGLETAASATPAPRELPA